MKLAPEFANPSHTGAGRRWRPRSGLPLLVAALALIALLLPLSSNPAQAQQADDPVWTATLGAEALSNGMIGYRHTPSEGSLSDRTFTLEEKTYSVVAAAIDPDPDDNTLYFSFSASAALESDFDGLALFIGAWSFHFDDATYNPGIFNWQVGAFSLTDGESYPVAVANSASTKPGTPPSGLTLAAGDQQLGASWSAPELHGGLFVSDYDLRYRPSGTSAWTELDDTTDSIDTSATLTGLTNDVVYEVQVRAENQLGAGAWSDSAQAAPDLPWPYEAKLTAAEFNLNGVKNVGYAATGGGSLNDLTFTYEGTEFTVTRLTVRDGAVPSVWLDLSPRLRKQSQFDAFDLLTLTIGEHALSFKDAIYSGAEQRFYFRLVGWIMEAGQTYDVSIHKPEPPRPIPTHHVLATTLTAANWTRFASLTTGYDSGLTNGASLSNRTFVIGGTTYTVESITTAGDETLQLHTSPYSTPDDFYGMFLTFTSSDGSTTAFPFAEGRVFGITTSWDSGGFVMTPDGVQYGVTIGAPPREPSAPGAPTLTGEDGGVAVSWTAPSDGGGLPVTDYDVRYRAASSSDWIELDDTTNSTDTSVTITGLTNYTEYKVQVRAENLLGEGSWSRSGTAFPALSNAQGALPGPPNAVTVTGGDAQLAVTWSPPSFTGGQSITDYDVRYWNNDTDGWVELDDTANNTDNTATITGLSNGQDYWVEVRSQTPVGAGPWSDGVRGYATGNIWSAELNTFRWTSGSADAHVGCAPCANAATLSPRTFTYDGTEYTVNYIGYQIAGSLTNRLIFQVTPGTPNEEFDGLKLVVLDEDGGLVQELLVSETTSVGTGDPAVYWWGNIDELFTPDTKYYLGIVHEDADLDSDVPGPVNNFNVQNTSGGFAATYDPPTDQGISAVAAYHWEWKEADDDWSQAATLFNEPDVFDFTIGDYNGPLVEGREYAIRMRARNAVGFGPWSGEFHLVYGAPATDQRPPGPVSNMFAELASEWFKAVWDAPADDGGSPITGYQVQWREADGPWKHGSFGLPGPYIQQPDDLDFIIHSRQSFVVDNWVNYTVRVRALSERGKSPWTDVSGMPGSGSERRPPLPGEITGLERWHNLIWVYLSQPNTLGYVPWIRTELQWKPIGRDWEDDTTESNTHWHSTGQYLGSDRIGWVQGGSMYGNLDPQTGYDVRARWMTEHGTSEWAYAPYSCGTAPPGAMDAPDGTDGYLEGLDGTLHLRFSQAGYDADQCNGPNSFRIQWRHEDQGWGASLHKALITHDFDRPGNLLQYSVESDSDEYGDSIYVKNYNRPQDAFSYYARHGVVGVYYTRFSEVGVYYARVRAENRYGVGPWLEYGPVTVAKPPAPTLSTTLGGALGVRVDWNPSDYPQNPREGRRFEIQWSAYSSPYENNSAVVSGVSTYGITSITLDGESLPLEDGVEYRVRIRFLADRGAGPWSKIATHRPYLKLPPRQTLRLTPLHGADNPNSASYCEVEVRVPTGILHDWQADGYEIQRAEVYLEGVWGPGQKGAQGELDQWLAGNLPYIVGSPTGTHTETFFDRENFLSKPPVVSPFGLDISARPGEFLTMFGTVTAHLEPNSSQALPGSGKYSFAIQFSYDPLNGKYCNTFANPPIGGPDPHGLAPVEEEAEEPVLVPVPAQAPKPRATPGDGQVTLSWTDPNNSAIMGWEVSQDDGNAWEAMTPADDGAGTLSHTVTDLINGTAYQFRIRAYAGSADDPIYGEASPVTVGQPQAAQSDDPQDEPATAPAQAPKPTATPGDGQVTLSWPNPDDASITGWEVSRTGGYAWEAMTLTDDGAGTLSHTVTDLLYGTAYHFRIRAYSGTADDPLYGDASPITVGQPQAAAEADTAPAFNANASIDDPGYTVGSAVSAVTLPTATGGNGDLSYTISPDLPAGLTLDADTGQLTGQPTTSQAAASYTYTVSDSDENTASGDTASLTFSIAIAPAQAPKPTATAGDGEVSLEWADPGDAGIGGWEVSQDDGSS